MPPAGLQITRGLTSPRQLSEAAQVFYGAFDLKLEHLILFSRTREQSLRLLERGLCPENAFFALSEGRVLGLAGLEEPGGRSFLDFSPDALQEEFGGLGALWRRAWLAAGHLYLRPRAGELRIDSLAVAETARGLGIGTCLLERVFEYARLSAFRAVTLEVIDTNPRARALYERHGFAGYKEERYGPITARAGLGGAIYMRKILLELS